MDIVQIISALTGFVLFMLILVVLGGGYRKILSFIFNRPKEKFDDQKTQMLVSQTGIDPLIIKMAYKFAGGRNPHLTADGRGIEFTSSPLLLEEKARLEHILKTGFGEKHFISASSKSSYADKQRIECKVEMYLKEKFELARNLEAKKIPVFTNEVIQWIRDLNMRHGLLVWGIADDSVIAEWKEKPSPDELAAIGQKMKEYFPCMAEKADYFTQAPDMPNIESSADVTLLLTNPSISRFLLLEW